MWYVCVVRVCVRGACVSLVGYPPCGSCPQVRWQVALVEAAAVGAAVGQHPQLCPSLPPPVLRHPDDRQVAEAVEGVGAAPLVARAPSPRTLRSQLPCQHLHLHPPPSLLLLHPRPSLLPLSQPPRARGAGARP